MKKIIVIVPLLLTIAVLAGCVPQNPEDNYFVDPTQPNKKCVPGETFNNECNDCMCDSDGNLICTDMECPPCDGEWVKGICVDDSNSADEVTVNTDEIVDSGFENEDLNLGEMI